jgi:4-hydroxythreonine-4-phosphate dehydrogenase
MSENLHKPLIGITLGDYNGIGPEVILKALHQNKLAKICTPVVYGSMKVLNRYKHLMDMKDWMLQGIAKVDGAAPKVTHVINCWDDRQTEVEPGKVTEAAGQGALACLQRAVEDYKAGHLAAIVTAPINKHNIQGEGFKFPGHTEFFTEAFEQKDSLMFLVSEHLKVGVVTGHIPLGRVRGAITQERVAAKLQLMIDSLKKDFGLLKPRVAVLGINPHAGEEGTLGTEEKEVINLVVEQFKQKGHLVMGTFPADGFFASRTYQKFDAVLAMYHDQGLIPFKMLAFEEGVNFTAGLPLIRTSPDHGTAYDIAGKGEADESSMLAAIFMALDIYKQRTVLE